MKLSNQETSTKPTPPLLTIEVDGQTVAVDDEGYLLDSKEWTPSVAELMAENDNLKLSEDHWIVITYLRNFYVTYAIAPELFMLQRTLCKSMDDCRWNRDYLRTLFPRHGARDACKYAGLPKPLKGACG